VQEYTRHLTGPKCREHREEFTFYSLQLLFVRPNRRIRVNTSSTFRLQSSNQTPSAARFAAREPGLTVATRVIQRHPNVVLGPACLRSVQCFVHNRQSTCDFGYIDVGAITNLELSATIICRKARRVSFRLWYAAVTGLLQNASQILRLTLHGHARRDDHDLRGARRSRLREPRFFRRWVKRMGVPRKPNSLRSSFSRKR